MNFLFTLILYAVVAVLMALSFLRDRGKTRLALKRAWNMFLNILPQFMLVVSFAAFFLVLVPTQTIEELLGTDSGIYGLVLAACAGAAALVPVMAVFPVVSQLLAHGAGVAQMAVFISTLTTVGLVTLPLESRYLGRKTALLRNLLFFLFAFLTAAVAGRVLP